MSGLNIGDQAPDFSLKNAAGKKRTLKDYKGALALYFYPKDDTPGCTKQACSIRDGFSALKDAGVTVVGVSADDAESHERFIKKYNLPFELLIDPGHKVAKEYHAYGDKNFYGKLIVGIKRTTFLIQDGKIVHIFKRVDVKNHAQQILDKLER